MDKAGRFLIILLLTLSAGIFLQFKVVNYYNIGELLYNERHLPPFLEDSSVWADSLLHQLSIEQKIAQSFMVAVYPNAGEEEKHRVARLIEKEQIGGIIFFQSSPSVVAEWAAYFQSISAIPLLTATDAEWGLAMRFDSTISYPRQMMLGAITDDELIEQMGADIGSQLRQLGIHINFAPVVDVNNNSNNPVINSRSFGEQRDNVALKGMAYSRGLQKAGVLAVAKHFPGHGDTDTDSHLGLPVLLQSATRLDSLELYPFRRIINHGVGGVMMAHMNVLSLDSTPNLPSTLSARIVDSLLLQTMQFKGLIFTDAMNMKGVSALYQPIEANFMAYAAGNDVLLMPHDIAKSIKAIAKAVKKGHLPESSVNRRCFKILQAKNWLQGFNDSVVYEFENLHNPVYYALHKGLIENSLTLLKGCDYLPLAGYDTLSLGLISIGKQSGDVFYKNLKWYTSTDRLSINASASSDTIDEFLKKHNALIVSLHTDDNRAYKDYGFTPADLQLIDDLLTSRKVTLVSFANPYLLKKVSNLSKARAIIVAYNNDSLTQQVAGQAIFGATALHGQLPVTINEDFLAGESETCQALPVLSYSSARDANVDDKYLYKIDSIVNDAIAQKAMPGCQVLAARNGKVFYHKAFGHFTYSAETPVDWESIYDLASITKVSATLPVIMTMSQNREINISHRLAEYWEPLDSTNKADITIEDILRHQAGLSSWIPFYQSLIEPVYKGQDLYSNRYSSTYPVQLGRSVYMNKHIRYKTGYIGYNPDSIYTVEVARNLYLPASFKDSIMYSIFASPVKEPGEYLYSDLGLYLLQWMIEAHADKKLGVICDSIFYHDLGATTLGYHPLDRFPRERIVPTENDIVFRKQIVQGYVHDPGAAMLGGEAGHAGLFSNANDLAKLFQMYLNGGLYGRKRFLEEKTIEKFIKAESFRNGNRRGLGFDKPEPDSTKGSPACRDATLSSFGHTGFTGTMVWADPETGLLYIFLSNRVYPDAYDNKLSRMDVRTNIQEILYKSIVQVENGK